MDLTALNGSRSSKGSTDRLRQGLCAVDDEEPRHRWIEAALDEIVDERLNGHGIFRRTLGQTKRVLVAIRVDTDCRNQDQVFVHMNAVDLDDQQIEPGKIGRHPLFHARP